MVVLPDHQADLQAFKPIYLLLPTLVYVGLLRLSSHLIHFCSSVDPHNYTKAPIRASDEEPPFIGAADSGQQLAVAFPYPKNIFALPRALHFFTKEIQHVKSALFASSFSILCQDERNRKGGLHGVRSAADTHDNYNYYSSGGGMSPQAFTNFSTYPQPTWSPTQQPSGTQNNPTPIVTVDEAASVGGRKFACVCAVFDPRGESSCVDAAGHSGCSRLKSHLKKDHTRQGLCRRCHRSLHEHPGGQLNSDCTEKPKKWKKMYYIDDVELCEHLERRARKGKGAADPEVELWYNYMVLFLCSHFKMPPKSIRMGVVRARYKPYQDDLEARRANPSPPASCNELFDSPAPEAMNGSASYQSPYPASMVGVTSPGTLGYDMTVAFDSQLDQSTFPFDSYPAFSPTEGMMGVSEQADQQPSIAGATSVALAPATPQPTTPLQQRQQRRPLPITSFTSNPSRSSSSLPQSSFLIPGTPTASSSNFDAPSPSPLPAAAAAAARMLATPATTVTMSRASSSRDSAPVSAPAPPRHSAQRAARSWPATEWAWQMFLKDFDNQKAARRTLRSQLRKEKRLRKRAAMALAEAAGDNTHIQRIAETLMYPGQARGQEQADYEDDEDEDDDDE